MTVLIDKRMVMNIVYLDFRKAFDTVSQNILTKKLLIYELD